ncbi:Small GTPase LIP1 [Camellia lanceoleosa]|uniref:Small GTPase LIP1 n=1 Tax=Camellia lanceoleosa TaxID=1840588 RepID=A0ACC0IVT3_9ERIC|nr:Small GTPase LIP1 [Camellia lanceoleosa]
MTPLRRLTPFRRRRPLRPFTPTQLVPASPESLIKSSIGDPYKYNILPPLPAQHNLTPPPTLYPQQPMSTPDNNYNTIPRFALSSSHDISSSSSARSKRTDINV